MGRVKLTLMALCLLTVVSQPVRAETMPNRMPLTTLQPTAQVPVTKLPAATPAITGFNPVGCYAKGAGFNILGKDFGVSQGSRVAALRGKGVSIDLPVNGWSDTRIRVRIPDVAQIQAGQWYSVGIATADHSQWLSKLDHNLQICETATASPNDTANTGLSGTLKQMAPPAASQSAIKQTTDETAAGDGQQAATPGSTDVAPPIQGGGGSLLGQGLPAPPVITDYTGERESDGNSEPGELLIVAPDLPQALQVQQLAQGLGLGIKRRSVLQGLGLVVSVFRVPQGTTPLQAVQQLRAQAPELWIDLNHRLTLQGGDARSYPRRMIGWPAAVSGCGQGVRIGLVDGPLPESHPLLADAAIERHAFVTHGVKSGPTDHALAIAAILAGGEGQGMTSAAELYVAEVMRQRDEDHVDTTVDWLIQGLDWLVKQHVELVNLSLGGPRNLILEAAVQRLLEQEIAIVAAAGNQGPSAEPVYPAASQGVIAVTAIDAERQLYRHANQGDYISFAAPGVDIWVPRGEAGAFVSGTSYAAPYVTALLAAHRQRQPQADWTANLQMLIDGSQDLGQPGRDRQFGYGLPQARQACGGG